MKGVDSWVFMRIMIQKRWGERAYAEDRDGHGRLRCVVLSDG